MSTINAALIDAFGIGPVTTAVEIDRFDSWSLAPATGHAFVSCVPCGIGPVADEESDQA